MIEAYLKKFDDFTSYREAEEIGGRLFLARVLQDDLERIKIQHPHIMRVLHAQEIYIKEMQEELNNLRDLVDGLLRTRKLLGEIQ